MVSILDLLHQRSHILDRVVYKNGGQLSCKLKLFCLQDRSNTQEWNREAVYSYGFYTNLLLIYYFYTNFHRRIMLLLGTCTSNFLRSRFPTYMNRHLQRFCVQEISCMTYHTLWRPEALFLLKIGYQGIKANVFSFTKICPGKVCINNR